MIQNVVVLGGGSAGFLSGLTLKRLIPDLSITILRSEDIGIIGVGEGSTRTLPIHLHGILGLDPGEFLRLARPTWKLGLRFFWGPRPYFDYTFSPMVDWRLPNLPKPNGFYCFDDFVHLNVNSALMSRDKVFAGNPNGDPRINRDFSYHIENEKFVSYLETMAQRAGVSIQEGKVQDVRQKEDGIKYLLLESGEKVEADLFVDCSGFRSLLLGRTLKVPYIDFASTLFCNRALVGGWKRTGEPIKPYTTVETMDSGWCWQIELLGRINRGYVYSSGFISDEKAEEEFRRVNPKIESPRLLRFPSGRYQEMWVKNVVAIGNASGFVEPLEATALGTICDRARILAQSLVDCNRRPGPAIKACYNHHAGGQWEEVRQFLGIHYKFNTRRDTPFWKACREDIDLAGMEFLVEYYQENGPSTFCRRSVLPNDYVFGMDGFLTLLMGQKVPFRKLYEPSELELQTWEAHREANRRIADRGLSVLESYAIVDSPQWAWNPEFFQRVS